MRITIVGAGAIGLLWACALRRHHSVQLWTRQQHKRHHCQLLPYQNSLPEAFSFQANDIPFLTKSELVILCVKAFQAPQAIKDIRAHLASDSPIIVMHNGMGSHSEILSLLPKQQPILYASTTQAALKTHRDCITHTGRGHTWLGAINRHGQQRQYLTTLLDSALPTAQWHEDILLPLWQKLAINAVINPLTALTQCRNGHLQHPDYSQIKEGLYDEVALVMNSEGYPTSAQQLSILVEQVIKATADNYSSMQQDIYHHRPTEIDYITGYILERARAHNLEVPHNLSLWQQIKKLESQT